MRRLVTNYFCQILQCVLQSYLAHQTFQDFLLCEPNLFLNFTGRQQSPCYSLLALPTPKSRTQSLGFFILITVWQCLFHICLKENHNFLRVFASHSPFHSVHNYQWTLQMAMQQAAFSSRYEQQIAWQLLYKCVTWNLYMANVTLLRYSLAWEFFMSFSL